MVIFEYASWHNDRNTTIYRNPVETNKMALNAVFTDGHAKKINGKQWRQLRDFGCERLGFGCPPKGMDLDWFLTDDSDTACPHCNVSSPANNTKDVD